MKFKDISLTDLVAMAKLRCPRYSHTEDVGVLTFLRELNAIVWRLNWTPALVTSVTRDEGEIDLPYVFRVARELREQKGPGQVFLEVKDGNLQGLYVYDPELALLCVHSFKENNFFVYFCHPEDTVVTREDKEVFEVLG